MQLYGYFRSSASYRVRIALNLKGLTYESVPVHLIKNGGEQFSAQFASVNPEALVPALVDEHEGQQVALSQSLAIMEYLEEKYPQTPLLPLDMADRATVRALALAIACDIHPINNLRVLKYLSVELGVTEDQKNAWYRHWCELGLAAIEKRLVASGKHGRCCFGDVPSIADCCLIPQIFNAQRFQCDLSAMPTIMAINAHCLSLPEFQAATPANQPEAE